MLKVRWLPHVIWVGIVAFVCLCYVGYQFYQKQVEFDEFISQSQEFYRSVKHDNLGNTAFPTAENHEHVHHAGKFPYGDQNELLGAVRSSSGLSFFKGKEREQYVYMINGSPHFSSVPLDSSDLDIREWIMTGEVNPAVEEQLRLRAETSPYKGKVKQRIVTPDGSLHEVIVPRDYQYEEGDAISESELDKSSGTMSQSSRLVINVAGVDYPMPDEFYNIEDRYERERYKIKFIHAKVEGISMEEVNKKIAIGEIDVELGEADAKLADEIATRRERLRSLSSFVPPPLSDKPPVKVSFLPDEGSGALPGWLRKLEGDRLSGSGEAAAGGSHLGADTFSEGSLPFDADTAPSSTDVPVSPSVDPGMVESTPFPSNMANLEKQLTPEGTKAELSKGVSLERFNKAQQLIDRYGSEEGIRRLKEVDPDVARQFEHLAAPKGQSPEQEQGEQKTNTEP